jgi:deoxyribonuclease-1
MKRVLLLLPALIFAASAASAADAPRGNTQFESFSQVKKILLNQVFNDHRTTIYCGASFTPDKQVILPKGFIAAKSPKRANRIEWEHILPAENFGRAFTECGKARRNA